MHRPAAAPFLSCFHTWLPGSTAACLTVCLPVVCLPVSTACVCVSCASVRRLSVDQVVADDAALDKSCTDALSFVRTCEQLRGYNKQIQPNTVGVLRGRQAHSSCCGHMHPGCVVLTL